MKNCIIMSIICFWLLVTPTHVYSGNYPDYWINNISKSSVNIICGDVVFLKKSGLSKELCRIKISNYSIKCNKLIRPLLPNEINDEFLVNNPDFPRNIGELYSLCLTGMALQE